MAQSSLPSPLLINEQACLNSIFNSNINHVKTLDLGKAQFEEGSKVWLIEGKFNCCYKFTAAEDDTWEQTLENPEGSRSKKGPLQEKKLKKSRWDNS
jgi:hypothetical protein